MKILYTGLTALLFTGASVGAAAQMGTEENGGVMGGGTTFDSLDTDGDGVLTPEEARAAGIDDQSFSEVDENGDGVISRDEYESGMSEPGGAGGWQ